MVSSGPSTTTALTVGVDLEENPQSRHRVRPFARHRLAGLQQDAYLAGKSDY